MKNKYNAKKTPYNGRLYDSKMECNYAIKLDWRKKAGEIIEIIPQYKISLDVEGVHICNYFIDFKITLADGAVEYIEVKGCRTAAFNIKLKLAKALYPEYNFVLVNLLK